ncbi:ribonuclease H-like domain-containing protein [Tanacetum coccineum]
MSATAPSSSSSLKCVLVLDINPKTTAWNEFSSTMASAIICLATNKKFNFSKFIFESMIRNLDNLSGKFLMYPRFVQVFSDQQLDGMPTHKRIYIAPSHTKKIFGNMEKDADHAGCQDTKRSTSGSMQLLGDRLVSWSSKKQKNTTISITEAEYIALLGFWTVGIKSLLDAVRIIAAQVYVNTALMKLVLLMNFKENILRGLADNYPDDIERLDLRWHDHDDYEGVETGVIEAEDGPNYVLWLSHRQIPDSQRTVKLCLVEEELKVVMKNDDPPIIEEWVSDNEEEDVSQPKTEKKAVRPSIVKKEFVKSKQQQNC